MYPIDRMVLPHLAKRAFALLVEGPQAQRADVARTVVARPQHPVSDGLGADVAKRWLLGFFHGITTRTVRIDKDAVGACCRIFLLLLLLLLATALTLERVALDRCPRRRCDLRLVCERLLGGRVVCSSPYPLPVERSTAPSIGAAAFAGTAASSIA